MTDRELLEAAAKAAGLTDATFTDMEGWGEVRYGLSFAIWAPSLDEYWNPLVSDGDALRLAVKLGIHISQQLSYCATFCPHGDNSTRGTTWTEQYNADPAAATRRAIVRAAAEIGRAP